MDIEQTVCTIVVCSTIAVATIFVVSFSICLIKEYIEERKKQRANRQ